MKKYYLLFLIFFAVTALSANDIIISFQPKGNTETIDSIHATNLTKGQTVKLNSGESLLIATATSSDLIKTSDSREGYLYPNPSNEYTTLNFNTAKNEKVYISIYDMAGKMLLGKTQSLTQGTHRFQLRFPNRGLYHVNVLTNGGQLNYKAVYLGRAQQVSEIKYLGSDQFTAVNTRLKSTQTEKSLDYSEGDVVHYTVYSGDNTTVISDTPTASKTIEVEFYLCKDSDNRNYKIVQIGYQWWMAENLAYLPEVSPSSCHSSTTSCFWVKGYQGTDVVEAKATNNYSTYGVLYNWKAALTSCPSGWHLPSDDEWKQLKNYLADNGYNIGKSLASTILWISSSSKDAIGNNLSANNSSGFSALPGGFSGGSTGLYGLWWSSTRASQNWAWYFYLQYNSWVFRQGNVSMSTDFSVRCVKDDETPPYNSSITTKEISDVSYYSATCGGIVTDGGGYEVIQRGVCWNKTGNPTVEDNKTEDGSGLGEFTSSLTGLDANTTYYVKAYAINSSDTAYGEEKVFTTKVNPYEPKTITDSRDCKTYKIEKIGDQWWMAENLAYNAGEGCWAYDNDESNVAAKYGRLYTWEVALKACPSGWHLPSDDEWEQLAQYVSDQKGPYYKSGDEWYDVGKHLKATNGWYFSGNGTDDFGFSALPGGYRYTNGDFYDGPTNGFFGTDGYWWSATEHGSDTAWYRYIRYPANKFYWEYSNKECGYSVRCVKDNDTSTSNLSITTKDIYDVSYYSATCGGIVTDGGGYEVIQRGVCWNTTGNPTVEDNKTEDGSGLGEFTSSLTGLDANTTYYVKAYVINSSDAAYGWEKVFTTKISYETETVTDSRDGKTYKTVKIGDQWWMAENLAYNAGEGCWAYDNEESNVATYGRLYTWEVALEACPSGWHLPSDDEWEQLAQYVSDQKGPYSKNEDEWHNVGKHLKANGTIEDGNGLWYKDDPDDEGTDDFGFSGLPGGNRNSGGVFYDIGSSGRWWSATESNSLNAWFRYMGYYNATFVRNYYDKVRGFSVRCVRD